MAGESPSFYFTDTAIARSTFYPHVTVLAMPSKHLNGRVYDPLISKFLSGDPLIKDPRNGQNYNRYSYVLNNPMNMTDPTGFEYTLPQQQLVTTILATLNAGGTVVFTGTDQSGFLTIDADGGMISGTLSPSIGSGIPVGLSGASQVVMAVDKASNSSGGSGGSGGVAGAAGTNQQGDDKTITQIGFNQGTGNYNGLCRGASCDPVDTNSGPSFFSMTTFEAGKRHVTLDQAYRRGAPFRQITAPTIIGVPTFASALAAVSASPAGGVVGDLAKDARTYRAIWDIYKILKGDIAPDLDALKQFPEAPSGMTQSGIRNNLNEGNELRDTFRSSAPIEQNPPRLPTTVP